MALIVTDIHFKHYLTKLLDEIYFLTCIRFILWKMQNIEDRPLTLLKLLQCLLYCSTE